MMRRSILSFAVAVAGALALIGLPEKASADSFVFGYSSGHRHKHHHYRHHHQRHHYSHRHHHHRPQYWSGFHHHRYYHRPPVVVLPPPVVYSAPPPVVYAEPPVVSAVPSSPIYQTPNGQYCREYQGMVTVNGVSQPSYGTACMMPDGSWRVVN